MVGIPGVPKISGNAGAGPHGMREWVTHGNMVLPYVCYRNKFGDSTSTNSALCTDYKLRQYTNTNPVPFTKTKRFRSFINFAFANYVQ